MPIQQPFDEENFKRLVKEKYPLCKNTAQRMQLAEELGLSMAKLYNIASRLCMTKD